MKTGLEHGAVTPTDLTPRQAEVAALVVKYFQVAEEMPSAGWLSRRLQISRERARQHLEELHRRGWTVHDPLSS